ncbi:hypothetical protein ACB098_05G127300 [Castanea mollissima]
MAVMVLGSFSLLHIHSHFPPIHKHYITSSSSNTPKSQKNLLTRRRTIAFGPILFVAVASSLTHLAIAQQQQEEDPLEQEEDRVVKLFQVTNYHVVAKLATDGSGIHRCKIYLADTRGNGFYREGKIVGVDPAYDLAVLKVNVEGIELKPVAVGTSQNLHVGQSCFAIGNPYGYENTLTTGVVSGLGREIPSPNGRAIRGAIQTDADINAGNSGGPLIDSYGHVIGVNTATFTRKGTGVSSGVNFAIPIDTVVRTVPYLIVYGTSYRDRF